MTLALRWRQRLASICYAALLWVARPAYRLRLWWRGRAEPLYRHAVGERFGRYADAPSEGWLWVHAVSLGETRACAALLQALRQQRPGLRILLTHATATGREAGGELLQPGDRQAWLPYDLPGSVRRFHVHFRPRLGVLMETEIWPNLLLGARRAGVPMVLANARLSVRSQRRGERLDALLRPAVESLALVLAQTEDDARRLRAAGAPEVVVSGNLKFDMEPDAVALQRGADWRAQFGRAVVLAASTREGEELPLLRAWCRQPAPRPLLLLVPRHPQRFDAVAEMVRGAGLTLARRSSWQGAPPVDARSADVWLGDSIGEMALYYGCAQVALLGGSFEALGGQNLIEAAACACPLLMGPHTFNFADAAERALQAGAALRVADIDAAVRCALELLASGAQAGMATRAAQFAASHRGAALRMARQIDALLARPVPAAVAGTALS